MKEYKLLIGGSWVTAQAKQLIDSIDPAQNLAWCRIARGQSEDADLAARAAHRAFRDGPWGSMTAKQRAAALRKLADLLKKHWRGFVEPEIRDNGKRLAEVEGQLSGLHAWFTHFAEELPKVRNLEIANTVPGIRNFLKYEPFGAIAAIVPWNSPLMIAAWKLAPALAAGNTVVLKPSELASASTLEFARLASTALPPGVLNVVTGFGHEVGEALVKHPLIRKVTFTGSEIGGQKVARAAAGRTIPATLELGGKSPQIVFADADLDSAVNGIAAGIFLSNGQTCVAGSRLIVEESIQEEVVSRIASRAAILRAGDPMDPETEIAPLANQAHFAKVASMIETAKGEGARCLLGGGRLHVETHPDGLFLAPAIFVDVSPEMEIWNEEVFGPVLAVISFANESEALELANGSRFGLAAGIWTQDMDKAQRLASRIEAGTVYINHYRSVCPKSPIGGYKNSGFGRELGPDAIRDFLQIKSVWSSTAPFPDPFNR